jgi:hypothetical protein
MGKVMGLASAQLGGTTEKTISTIVKNNWFNSNLLIKILNYIFKIVNQQS